MSFVIQSGSPAASVYIKTSRIFPAAVTGNAITFGDTSTTNGGLYLTPFFVPGKIGFSNIGIHTSGTLSVNVVAGIYKYSYDDHEWSLVTQVGPFSTGSSGIHTIAVTGSLITIEQGLYATAITADGVQTDVTGYDVDLLGNFAGTLWSGAARNSFYFIKTGSYSATMPATIVGGDANAGGTSGDDIPGCFLLIA